MNRCASCHRLLFRGHGPIPPGHARHAAHGECKSCYNRARYTTRRPAASQYGTDLKTRRLEDLQWMAETGESAIGAAARLGISVDALEKWCRTHGHQDLHRRLVARNPVPIREESAA